jgi:hypothetical protein
VFRRSLIVLFALLLAVPVLTAAASDRPSFSLPDQASEIAPGVFFLGHAVEDGVDLVGYAYARYATADENGRRANAKPDNPGGGGGNGGGKPGGGGGGGGDPVLSCYSFIAKGAHWISPESYVFDSANTTIGSVGLSGTNGVFGTWEDAAGDTPMVDPGALFDPDSEPPLSADTSGTDGNNEIYFAAIDEPGVLGYTIVWSTRSRGPLLGQIVEADMVIDDDGDWSWYTGTAGSIVADGGQIDFWSVFTHEAGHWVGMGHTDTTDVCAGQTMFPYIDSGDSTKRLLGDGDMTGVSALYG